LAPRYVAYLAGVAFMAFSGLTSTGLARNIFENQFRITQLGHFFPTPNAIEHARDLQSAKLKGWLKGWDISRIPKRFR
jgi:hypothetical protein